ncbi:MAG: hypothetical protein J6X18_16080 [Bacteroidales bacterium]|nr:hypothetical protein [Bacteroidales bacterium]
MKVEVKEVVDQVTDALKARDYWNVWLADGYKAAICQDNGHIAGWVIVKVEEDGTLTKKSREFKDLADLFENWYKNE